MILWMCFHCGKDCGSIQGLVDHTIWNHSVAPEHLADKPGGLSGPTTGSEAERSGAVDQALDLPGNSRVQRRSEAEPLNDKTEVRP